MDNLWIREDWVNATDKVNLGESGVYETGFKSLGSLYRSCVKEYGRCISKVYIDKDDKSIPIGWVFIKKRKYEDCNEYYLQETWITVHDGLPERSIKYKYHPLG